MFTCKETRKCIVEKIKHFPVPRLLKNFLNHVDNIGLCLTPAEIFLLVFENDFVLGTGIYRNMWKC